MQQYVLNVWQPVGPPPATVDLAKVMAHVDAVDQLITEGPYVEDKEHLGGFSIISAPDLDAALEWGRELARATGLPPPASVGSCRDVAPAPTSAWTVATTSSTCRYAAGPVTPWA